jgi:hypothetical protein
MRYNVRAIGSGLMSKPYHGGMRNRHYQSLRIRKVHNRAVVQIFYSEDCLTGNQGG